MMVHRILIASSYCVGIHMRDYVCSHESASLFFATSLALRKFGDVGGDPPHHSTAAWLRSAVGDPSWPF